MTELPDRLWVDPPRHALHYNVEYIRGDLVTKMIEDAVKEERKACVQRIKMVEYLAIEELTEALESAAEEKTQERG